MTSTHATSGRASAALRPRRRRRARRRGRPARGLRAGRRGRRRRRARGRPSSVDRPSSAIAGTRRRSPRTSAPPVKARPSRPGPARASSTPGGRSGAERVRRPGEQRERAVVARHEAPRPDELGATAASSRAHREVVADREHRHVGGVDAPDQRHVAEDVRVAGEVDRRPVVESEHEPARLAEVHAARARSTSGWRRSA